MKKHLPELVFCYRRYFSILALLIPLIIKILFSGKTNLSLYIAGLLVVLAGILFRIYSAGYLHGKHTVTEINADFLCCSGPYSYIRNPLYVGNFLIGTGICISFNEWYGYVIFFAYFVMIYSLIVPFEEQFLTEKFGDVYLEYRKQTTRFFPGYNSYKAKDTVVPLFKPAFIQELPYIAILAAAYISFYFLFLE